MPANTKNEIKKCLSLFKHRKIKMNKKELKIFAGDQKIKKL